VAWADLSKRVPEILDTMQSDLLNAARERHGACLEKVRDNANSTALDDNALFCMLASRAPRCHLILSLQLRLIAIAAHPGDAHLTNTELPNTWHRSSTRSLCNHLHLLWLPAPGPSVQLPGPHPPCTPYCT
jgi:hypothetical protein